MAKTADERLNYLEAKSVFQEDTIEKLSNELRKQQQELISPQNLNLCQKLQI